MKRGAKQSENAVSLFPFLAVLLCTMGALIVVLIVTARAARIRTSDTAPTAVSIDELTARQALLSQRNAELARARDRAAALVNKRRLDMEGATQDLDRLQSQLSKLEAAANQVDKSADEHATRQLRDDLQRVAKSVARAEEELKNARHMAQANGPSYAVVPYAGPNETMRRPIYLECCADRIILQPEGIEFSPDDFLGPLGPGNPLAATLRAVRDYLGRVKNTDLGESGEPYPLLLVRPDGVEAYYAAREAMLSWSSAFGYELIDQDWKLDFGQPNPAVAEVALAAIEQARIRQEQIARAAPRLTDDAEWFRASPVNGGVMRDGSVPGTGGGRHASTGYPKPNSPWNASRSGTRGSGACAASEGSAAGRGGGSTRPGYESLVRQGSGLGDHFGENSGTGTTGTGSGADGHNPPNGIDAPLTADAYITRGTNTADSPLGTGALAQSPSRGGGQYGSSDGDPTASHPGSADGTGRESSTTSDSPNHAPSNGSTATSSSATARGAGAPGSSFTVSGTPNNPSSTGGSAASINFDKSNANAGAPSSSPHVSIAHSRGKDWGLPDESRSAVPISRPIRVECTNEKFIVRRENGQVAKEIAIGSRTQDSIDELVSSVWQEAETWGLAGRGMYWRPTLSVDVAPTGEARYIELSSLMTNSGLDVQRAATKPAATATKPRKFWKW